MELQVTPAPPLPAVAPVAAIATPRSCHIPSTDWIGSEPILPPSCPDPSHQQECHLILLFAQMIITESKICKRHYMNCAQFLIYNIICRQFMLRTSYM